MCLSAGLPEGQNVTGIPTTKSCPEVGDTGFPQAGAYLADESPGGEKSDAHTHRYSEHSCLLWGCKELPETHGGRCKKKKKKGKGREGRSCFSLSLAALASRVTSQKRHMARQV